MSIARHHNEWLSLLEISGPFLSMPALLRVFPQGLDALDRELLAELRQAYDEWLDDQNSLRPTPAIHTIWVRYVLERVLGFDRANLLEGPAIPANVSTYVAEQGETLRPDLVIAPHPQLLPLTSGQVSQGERGARVLVQIHPITQGLEKTMQGKHWKASPAMRMLELLRATGVSLGLVTNGEQWMLVNAPRGETSTFVSWYAALWMEEPLTLRAFCSLLGAPRFFSVANEDTLEGMLKQSVNEQQEVTDQLGYQVRRAVEVLTRAVDKADQDRSRKLLKNVSEADLYEAALTVMMRLVFLFSAEERGLLLLGDPLYDQNYAVSTLRAQLRETADQQGEEVLERRFDAWCRLLATFRAVYGGIHHDRLNQPAYGGSLFDPERFPFLEGRASSDLTPDSSPEMRGEPEPLPISNRTVLHLLEALQILRVKVPGGGPAEPRRLSFRSLDVEQIGHVYEGLLDHIAKRAAEPVLGLVGTRDKEPEIALSTLQAEAAKGEKMFLAFLKEQTGRTENALKRAWQEAPDVFAVQHLQIACNNDASVFNQVVKYAGLVREDDFGYPIVFLAGSVYVTAGATRRATGTHYTPRSLTEPIVQHTLEPLVYIGPAEGLPKEQWQLHSPAELLELKVCDMAMGSAGFLVQVIRYLSERLVESWEVVLQTAISKNQPSIQITPEGQPATGRPGETIIPRDDEERLILARRLVADRCIYGVDKNPLAVEIAKLSIWLTTMDKGRPFTFLDHALKCGDSLVGTEEKTFLRWTKGWGAVEAPLFDEELQKEVDLARKKRRALEAFTVTEPRDAERKTELLKEADVAMKRVKVGCDLLTGARLLGLSKRETETLQLNLLLPYMAGSKNESEDAQRALSAAQAVRAFHWEFEFPEVFEKGGFSAFVGNPPFMRGKSISTNFGDNYYSFLKTRWSHRSGSADYCTYFFLQSFYNLCVMGKLGLIATNTISQGDTREVGLDFIVINKGAVIYRAINNHNWPGMASVAVSVVFISKKSVTGKKILDDAEVEYISSFLDNRHLLFERRKLQSNEGLSHMGTNVLGLGFTMTEIEANTLIAKNNRNAEILFPYINGQDLNSNPDQVPSRWIINFFDWPLVVAKEYPECFEIAENNVKPQRDLVKRSVYKNNWWQFAEKQKGLYRAIQGLDRVLAVSKTSKYHSFAFLPARMVFDQSLIIFAFSEYSQFAQMQSSIHTDWVLKFGSTLETRPVYTPTDCFDSYPFPINIEGLKSIGESYYEHRRQIMLARQEGLTATYNRFHNPKEKASDIAQLRELHMEMDHAVAAAYGWSDLELGHGFHETPQGIRYTISEEARREVLRRLLELNHERYEEEVKQGLHEKKGKGKRKGPKVKVEKGQGRLF